MTELDLRVVQFPHWLAWLQLSVGGTVKVRASSHLCGPMALGSAGGRWLVTVLVCPLSPRPLWHLVSRGTKGCREAGAVSPLPHRSPLTQGKLPGRHIPGTSASSYCQSIANSVKWTKISTSSVQMLESTRDFQHAVVESQSCCENEIWLSPSLRDLVLRFWFT